jgi:Concanavalin A-like lectin/glucanases superfamily/Secretion system C-terminal sorting domain
MIKKFTLFIFLFCLGLQTQAQWINVGTAGFSPGASSHSSFAINSGTPYMAFRDDANSSKVSVMKFDGISWVFLGAAGFSAGSAYDISLAFNGSTPYVAYQDNGNGDKVTVMQFNGTAWVVVGTAGISIGGAGGISLAFAAGEPYVAYSENSNSYKATVMKFNGTSWVDIGGAGFTTSSAEYISLAFDGTTPYIAFQDGANSIRATVMKYNGTAWVNVGSAGFSAGTNIYNKLVFNGTTPYLAFRDGSNSGKATVMQFDGTSWVNVGSPAFSAGAAEFTSLAINGGTAYVAYKDNSLGQKAVVKKFDGTNWITLGAAGFSAGVAGYTSLAFNGGIPYVAYSDGANGNKASVMKYCTATTSTINVTIANTTAYLFNGQNLKTSGTYLDTIPNVAGCDSIITLNLTVKTGTALHFAGTDAQIVDDQIVVPHNAAYNVNAFTMEAWVKEDNSSNNTIFSKGGSNGVQQDGSYFFYMSQNKLGFYSRPKGHYLDTLILCPGTWNHVAATYDGVSTLQFYVNGIASKTFTMTGPLASPGNSLLGIGVQGPLGSPQDPCNCNRFNGALDELRMWNIARTQAEIQASLNAELAGNEIGLVGYWKLNAGDDGANNAGLITAFDATPNANNGTLEQFNLTGTTSNWVAGNNLLMNGCKKEIFVSGNGNSICNGDITPSTSDFTNLGTGITYAPIIKTFVLKNLGKDSLHINANTITGTHAANFTSSLPNTAFAIAGDSSYTFTVTYTNTIVGIKNASLNFTTDDCDEPTFTYALQSNAITCSIIRDTITETICSGSSFVFNGMAQNSSGFYADTFVKANGCDSFVVLNLVVNPIITTTLYDTICSGSTYIFNNQTLSTSGVYYDTLANTAGCDSIIALNLFVNPIITTTLYDTICSGSTYIFNNQTISTSGLYNDTLVNAAGCDSVLTLDLFVKPIITSNIYDTICSGTIYTFNNQNISTSGLYYDTLLSAKGCDSTITLSIIVIETPSIIVSADDSAVCLNNSVTLSARNANCIVQNNFENDYKPTSWFSPSTYLNSANGFNATNYTLTIENINPLFPQSTGYTNFHIKSTCTGVVSFDYSYTNPAASNEEIQFQFFTVLGSPAAGTSTGTYTANVNAGDLINITLRSYSNSLPGVLKIFNFKAPSGLALTFDWKDSLGNTSISSYQDAYPTISAAGANAFYAEATSPEGCVSAPAYITITGDAVSKPSIVVSNTAPCFNSGITASTNVAGNTILNWFGSNFYLGSGDSIATAVNDTSEAPYFKLYLLATDTLTGCFAVGDTAILYGNPNGEVAQTSSTNLVTVPGVSNNTQSQPDGLQLSYYDANCNLIASVQDTLSGNILGLTTAIVHVDSSVKTFNAQPYCQRWFDITPQSQGAANVILYVSQNDFDNYNAYASANAWPLLPANYLDSAGIANIRITKLHRGGLGIGTTEVITPTASWNAVNNYWTLSFSIDSFSEFYIHSVNVNNSPLAITLLNFDGKIYGENDVLNWITANEKNNDYFILQHGKTNSDYTNIATIKSIAANENSTSILNYSYKNNKPSFGHNYYRLQQVDLSGKITTQSKIVDLFRSADGSIISVYPNPTSGKFNIDINAQKAEAITIKVYDMTGKIVRQVETTTTKGVNTFTLDIEALTSGTYNVQVSSKANVYYTQKLKKD